MHGFTFGNDSFGRATMPTGPIQPHSKAVDRTSRRQSLSKKIASVFAHCFFFRGIETTPALEPAPLVTSVDDFPDRGLIANDESCALGMIERGPQRVQRRKRRWHPYCARPLRTAVIREMLAPKTVAACSFVGRARCSRPCDQSSARSARSSGVQVVLATVCPLSTVVDGTVDHVVLERKSNIRLPFSDRMKLRRPPCMAYRRSLAADRETARFHVSGNAEYRVRRRRRAGT